MGVAPPRNCGTLAALMRAFPSLPRIIPAFAARERRSTTCGLPLSAYGGPPCINAIRHPDACVRFFRTWLCTVILPIFPLIGVFIKIQVILTKNFSHIQIFSKLTFHQKFYRGLSFILKFRLFIVRNLCDQPLALLTLYMYIKAIAQNLLISLTKFRNSPILNRLHFFCFRSNWGINEKNCNN